MTARTYLRIDLEVVSPVVVGAWQDVADAGAGRRRVSVAKDRAGRPVIPASGLAGSLRDHLRQVAAGTLTRLLGPEPPSGPGSLLAASTLAFMGTVLPAERWTLTTTARTAIDPWRRAARAGSFRDHEQARPVGPGPHLQLYCRLDGRGDDPGAHSRLRDVLLDALPGWQPRLGGQRTNGAGRARVTSLRWRTFDLSRGSDLEEIALGAGEGPARVDAWLARGERRTGPAVPDEPVLEVTFGLPDGLLVPDGGEGGQHDGSGWKGVLRSRVAFVARTVGRSACTVQHGCGQCDVCAVFGSFERRGLLVFSASPLQGARHQRSRQRVAIDRWQGGALDRHLFTETTVHGAAVTLRIEALAPLPDWLVRALLLAVRDLADGLIGIGGGGSGGLGRCELAGPVRLSATLAEQMKLSGRDGRQRLHLHADDLAAMRLEA